MIQKETGREFGPYWVLNILRTVDALDEEQTFWNGGSPPSQDEPHVITKIIKPAIIKEKVSGANLFCLRVRGKVDGAIHYISHSLVEHLEKENVVLGLYLRYVKVV